MKIDKDGYLELINNFIPQHEAQEYFNLLNDKLCWEKEEYVIYGKSVVAPRLVCWYGDKDAAYTYSGVLHQPLAWTETLKKVKQLIEEKTLQTFNSVLANLYRDGKDSIGWHADKEKELGENPFIASLSFGASRIFKIQHNKSREIHDIDLDNGSLLLMSGKFQHCWRHCVPKSMQIKEPRINLTFRKIIV